jgi:beta-glucosidase
VINSPEHRALAREAAAKSIVLLTNKNKTLPLPTEIRSILVTGPNSTDTDVLLANYSGVSGDLVTVLEGITNAVRPSTVIFHNKGTALDNDENQNVHWQIDQADAVVAVLGLSPLFEGEQGDAYLSKAGGDKKDISFPAAQLKYLKALREKTKKPIVVVLTAGSAIDLREVESLADAVLLAWYPGEQGGNAIADVIFGKINPAGRLPVTFYNSDKDLPPFEDYSMKGRTYRYFAGKPLHPFGFGSSYTTFEYSDLSFSQIPNGFRVAVDVRNSGERDGDEVVQVYVRRLNAGESEPLKRLVNYKRIYIPRGKTAHVDLSIARSELMIWDERKNARSVIPGEYEILIGASSEDIRLRRTIRVN